MNSRILSRIGPKILPVTGRILLFLGAFWAGFVLFFPAKTLEGRLEDLFRKEIGTDATIEGVTLIFPLGIEAQSLEIIPKGAPPLTIEEIEITPSWLSLFTGNPTLRLKTSLYGGRIEGEARRDGSFAAHAEELTIPEALSVNLPVRLSGTISALDAEGTFLPPSATLSRLSSHIDNMTVAGLEPFGVPDGKLTLGAITLKGGGKGRSFRLEELRTENGDLDISATGSLLFVDPSRKSRLNMTLSVKPLPKTPQGVVALMESFGGKSSETLSLSLSGSFDNPSFKIIPVSRLGNRGE